MVQERSIKVKFLELDHLLPTGKEASLLVADGALSSLVQVAVQFLKPFRAISWDIMPVEECILATALC